MPSPLVARAQTQKLDVKVKPLKRRLCTLGRLEAIPATAEQGTGVVNADQFGTQQDRRVCKVLRTLARESAEQKNEDQTITDG